MQNCGITLKQFNTLCSFLYSFRQFLIRIDNFGLMSCIFGAPYNLVRPKKSLAMEVAAMAGTPLADGRE
jgi:hypothetical protein